MFTSRSHSKFSNAALSGMEEVSRPLSSVPTRENVRCRMWLLSRCRFFLNSIARVYRQHQQPLSTVSVDVESQMLHTDQKQINTTCHTQLLLLLLLQSTTCLMAQDNHGKLVQETSGYATWFTAGGAIRIAHYDVIDDVITRKL